ncbi:uncharacterized protein si:ch211-248a14.8 [Syngnathus scovelli]|uniref:uncharacterized protein si:ch211-248a14.8 n=1 Tax=Syngnathus scovelli TaxID=161590 RepID=UPI00210FBBDD|nr:uncharacterized protein si:ch211-248a14.8 [Syngnathus scovelli]
MTLRRMPMCLLSERWRSWRWCSFTLTTFSSNQALKALLPFLCAAVIFLYGLAVGLRSFVAGIFLPQYHYPYAVALCFGQVLSSVFFFNLLHLLGVAPLRRFSRPLAERLLVPSICNSVHAVLAMWAEANSSDSGLFSLVLQPLPLITMGLSFALKLTAPPSGHTLVLVSILTGSSLVCTARHGLSVVEPLEYMYAPLAVMLLSLSLTWLSKVSEADRRFSALDIYYASLVNQCWLLGLLWTLHPEGPLLVLSRASWHSLLFHAYLLAILLLGTLLNFVMVMSALCISPLAAALLHLAGELLQPFVQLLWF